MNPSRSCPRCWIAFRHVTWFWWKGSSEQSIPKIEVHRVAAGTPLLFPDDPHIVALATDIPISTRLPTFGLDDYTGIAGFMLKHLGLA